MSTNSYIARQVSENVFRCIYCHWDGYLEWNGAVLVKYYDTPEKVDHLLGLGDLSFLGPHLEPDPEKPHTFDRPQENVTVAYGRDRREQGTGARVLTMAKLKRLPSHIEFVYIYTTDGVWCVLRSGELCPVADLLPKGVNV